MSEVWREGEQAGQRGAASAEQREDAKDRDARKPRGKLSLRYGAAR